MQNTLLDTSAQYAMYLRKSREDEQAEQYAEGETLARHKKMLYDLADQLSIPKNHIDIFEEVVSGESIAGRPEIQKLLPLVSEQFYAGVFVVEFPRLARGDSIDQGIITQAFKFSGTKIITPGRIYDLDDESDETFSEFGLFMARQEYKSIRRRMRNGVLAAAKEGKWPFNRTPFGFCRVKLEHEKGWILADEPSEVALRKQLWDWLTEDQYSMGKICTMLHELGYKTRYGNEWTVSTLTNFFRNPACIGKIQINNRNVQKKVVDGKIIKSRPRNTNPDIYEGRHKGYITKEQFAKGQKILDSHQVLPCHSNMPLTNPLAGILICKHCGRHMIRKKYTSSTGKSYDMVLCPNKYCDCVSSSYQAVENSILAAMHSWSKNINVLFQELKPLPDEKPDFYQNTVTALETEIDSLKTRLEKCYTFLETGLYSPEEFIQRRQSIENALSERQAAYDTALTHLDEIMQIESGRILYLPMVQNVLEMYNGLDTAQEKHDLLSSVLERVEYTKTERNKKFEYDVQKYSLTLYPKLPK